MAFSVPEYAILTSEYEYVYYGCLIKDEDNNAKYVRKQKVVAMRNEIDGRLVPLNTTTKGVIPWVKLYVRKFNVEGQDRNIPICQRCNDSAQSISTTQTNTNLTALLCHHTKVAINILKNKLDETEESVDDNDDDTCVEVLMLRQNRTTKCQNLGTVSFKGEEKVALLYTTGRKQSVVCDSCSEHGCCHQKAWKKVIEGDITNDETAQNDDEESVTNVTNSVHYLNYESTYYNQTEILFPLK